jgi:ABC-type Fe3+/spermidine/putrescine transport system ATPase subunit
MRAEIKQIHTQIGRTMIYVTHDQAEALSMADRIAIMRHGRVVQVGPPRLLYSCPASTFVAEFVGGTNILPGKSQQVSNIVVVDTPVGLIRATNCPAGLARGDRVNCSVRPEAIHVKRIGSAAKLQQTVGEAALNHLTGEIQDIMYLGNSEQYLLRLADGTLLQALEYNPVRNHAEIGESVTITFNFGDVVVLPAEGRDD